MRFSIVIPSYNGEAYVEGALLSVLNQTRAADEIIISDDNSSDGTVDICKKYSERGVKIYTNTEGPSGFVNGWNKAIARADGDYISILHQDDLLMPSFLEEAERALALYPAARHLFTSCVYINEKGEVIREIKGLAGTVNLYLEREYIRLYRESPLHIHRCPGVITHRSIFEHCCYRAEAGHIADDDFFYRVGKFTDVIGIMKPLACYREHKNSETGHLADVQLNRRLVRDYDFQMKQLVPGDPHYACDRDFFAQNRRRHARRLLGYGLRSLNVMDVWKGLRYL